jgi:acylphosphatase
VPALRDADRARVVHEPLQLQLPELSAAPESAPLVTGQDRRRRAVALVSGSVQGVGYRWFVRGRADAAGLAGSATNLPDGRVEVVLEGPGPAVAAVLADLEGPRAPGAVTRVDVRDEPVQGSTGFTTA